MIIKEDMIHDIVLKLFINTIEAIKNTFVFNKDVAEPMPVSQVIGCYQKDFEDLEELFGFKMSFNTEIDYLLNAFHVIGSFDFVDYKSLCVIKNSLPTKKNGHSIYDYAPTWKEWVDNFVIKAKTDPSKVLNDIEICTTREGSAGLLVLFNGNCSASFKLVKDYLTGLING